MTVAIMEVVSAFASTLAFGVLFNIRGKNLWLAALGGMLAWVIFLLLGLFMPSEAARYLLVSILISIYSEGMARFLHTPATTFCIVSLIPLIPGGSLYYTMRNALQGNSEGFIERATATMELAAALALGILLVTACARKYPLHLNKK